MILQLGEKITASSDEVCYATTLKEGCIADSWVKQLRKSHHLFQPYSNDSRLHITTENQPKGKDIRRRKPCKFGP